MGYCREQSVSLVMESFSVKLCGSISISRPFGILQFFLRVDNISICNCIDAKADKACERLSETNICANSIDLNVSATEVMQ